MTIKKFKEDNKDFCNKYNETLDLYYRCSLYIEKPERTAAEVDKYCKMLMFYAKTLSLMMIEYRTITGEELSDRQTLGGFIQYETVK